MAQLKNTDRIFTLDAGQAITVGNNRTVTKEHTDGAVRYVGRLHGHPVFTIALGDSEEAFVQLDTCGWLTTTTCAAMMDFASAFGVRMGVSRAGGKLSARWFYRGEWHEGEGDPRVLTSDRYV